MDANTLAKVNDETADAYYRKEGYYGVVVMPEIHTAIGYTGDVVRVDTGGQ